MTATAPHWTFIGTAGDYAVWKDGDQECFQVSRGGPPSDEGGYKYLDTLLGLKNLKPHHFKEGKRSLTVLVHPGSACGSADMNLGKYDARAARDGLVLDIGSVDGDLLVIDGSLSDELAAHPLFDAAIRDALTDARARGHVGRRVRGSDDEDYDQTHAARDYIAGEMLSPETHHIRLTGAWYDHDGDQGCINSVLEVFEAAGFSVAVMDNAISLDDSAPELDDEDAEADPSPTL